MHFTKQINLKQCLTKMDKVIIIVCCIFICISIALLCGAYAMRDIPGNTIGNIRNYGYATEQDGWIYYLAPNEESTQVGIFKIRNNGQDKQQLYMSALDIVSLIFLRFVLLVLEERLSTEFVHMLRSFLRHLLFSHYG